MAVVVTRRRELPGHCSSMPWSPPHPALKCRAPTSFSLHRVASQESSRAPRVASCRRSRQRPVRVALPAVDSRSAKLWLSAQMPLSITPMTMPSPAPRLLAAGAAELVPQTAAGIEAEERRRRGGLHRRARPRSPPRRRAARHASPPAPRSTWRRTRRRSRRTAAAAGPRSPSPGRRAACRADDPSRPRHPTTRGRPSCPVRVAWPSGRVCRRRISGHRVERQLHDIGLRSRRDRRLLLEAGSRHLHLSLIRRLGALTGVRSGHTSLCAGRQHGRGGQCRQPPAPPSV